MSGKTVPVAEDKTTTAEQTSTQANTTNSTENQPKAEGTTQEKDLTSKDVPGILEEGLSDKDPGVTEKAEDRPAPTGAEVNPAEVDKPMEAYELELSDESPLTDEEFDEVVQEAERLKLNKEDAEKLIAMREYSHKASNEIFEAAAKEKVQGMVKSYRADESLHTVEAKLSLREAIKTFGEDPSFKEMFKDPAMNFNIPLAKFLITVGDKIRGATNKMPVTKGSSFETEASDPISKAANNFYKNM